jgi:hypothetical protein
MKVFQKNLKEGNYAKATSARKGYKTNLGKRILKNKPHLKEILTQTMLSPFL